MLLLTLLFGLILVLSAGFVIVKKHQDASPGGSIPDNGIVLSHHVLLAGMVVATGIIISFPYDQFGGPQQHSSIIFIGLGSVAMMTVITVVMRVVAALVKNKLLRRVVIIPLWILSALASLWFISLWFWPFV